MPSRSLGAFLRLQRAMHGGVHRDVRSSQSHEHHPGKLFRQPVPTGHACLSAATRELPFCNTSLSIGARLDDLIGRLSLHEKAGLIGPDPVTSPCAFLDNGVKRLDIPPYLYLVETNTAVASACIISQDKCATTFIGPTGLGAAFNRVISTEIRAFNNLNWHRGGGILQDRTHRPTHSSSLHPPPFNLWDAFLSREYAAAYVAGCQDGPDRKYKKMTASLRHVDAHSVETNRMAFNGNISTFDLWDTEYKRGRLLPCARTPASTACPRRTLNGSADMELGETYFTTNGYLAQAVKQTRTTMDTVNNAVRRVLKDSFITGQWHRREPNLPLRNGPCISECPDGDVCEEPFIETIPPTLTTDRLCSCDTLTCNKLITQLFEEMMDAYEARRCCPGCTDTCECSAGFILVYDADPADCRPCDSVTEFSTSIGGSKCEAIEECERGQEEVAAPTRCSLDRVCRACPAGTIDSDSDGSTGCQMCPRWPLHGGGLPQLLLQLHLPRRHPPTTTTTATPPPRATTSQSARPGLRRCRASHSSSVTVYATSARRARTRLSLASQGVSCLPVTTCAAGEEEIAEPTPTSDHVCSQCELGATFKPVERPGRVMPPRHSVRTFPRTTASKCEFGTVQSQVPTLDSNRECTLECSECPSGRFEIRACSALEHMHATRRRSASAPPVPPHFQVRPWRAARIRAPTSTSDTKCEPCPIGTTDHDRNPLTACQPCSYGHYVPACPIGSCEQFLCQAGTTNLDRNANTRRVRRARLAWTLPPSLAQRDCTTVAECNLGYEEMVRPAMRPTIFTDRQCRRCIEGLFYRNSNTGFCMRVCRPASLARICSPWTQFLSNEYELVAPSLVNDRECQRVRTRASTQRVHHRHRRLPQRGVYALLFSRSVSGDVTVMGSTASPCEADVSWTTRPFGSSNNGRGGGARHGNSSDS
ncbi:hypothetical protein PTSG_10406 [Salpingoeca rosetta]|uniref:TNFR-Cys domain-containing protein n=1 Tax=Salpingoeca rosetta (strain ATCC 50818 / BSB-021) TaxID=946362 RepID=F2UPK1_SALR5|nr:uncharacterized protein PTSG_10406 [Salpingoeca rosetta]EGD79556.1 hypothetical protein PTSG_10406 [Salpingoeca rosetta]|eukprot:XP_004988784.1 hypothetical protein PTSG_10406 [Salpingoeca rosetta]